MERATVPDLMTATGGAPSLLLSAGLSLASSSWIPMDLALAVFIPWDVCPLGVLLGGTLDRDRRAGLQCRVEELGHRLADLLAQSRPVPAEVLDVPLVKNEPIPEGDARAGPRGEVPAQPAELGVGIPAPDAGALQVPPDVRVDAPLDPRPIRQQRHVHRLSGGT